MILSVDPSTKASGWAVFDNEHNLIDYGVFTRQEDVDSGRINRNKRIIYMVQQLESIVEKYHIDSIVEEDVPPAINNSDTVLALGNLQGAMIFMAMKHNIPIDFIPVPRWHSYYSILKKNGDLKEQSIRMTNEKYGLNLVYKSPSSKFNEDNQSDAILIGHYWLHTNDYNAFGKKLKNSTDEVK